jgi:hypothetical protein
MDLIRIRELLGYILRKEFAGNIDKQKIYEAGNRLNISCPYCGDSSNPKKKRGNFYIDTLTYKCYNGGCGIYKDAYSMFRDFHVSSKLEDSEKKDIVDLIKSGKEKRQTAYGEVDISLFFNTDFKSTVVTREKFMSEMNLREINGSKMETYLIRRNQVADNKFAWDPKTGKLYLFNLTKDNEILGLQFRNMNSSYGSKYYTYKLSGIWEKLLKETDLDLIEESKKIDPVSFVFNIGKISFDRTITIFEGPMDSWLWKNSVALCSVENKFPFDIENVQYWYDWDEAGREKHSELLSSGKRVFNWKKFLLDHDLPIHRKWDLNELVNFLRSGRIKIRRLDNYFTEEILDLSDFIYA